jgi:hypothetical protein
MSFESSFLPHKQPDLQKEREIEKTIERVNLKRKSLDNKPVPNNPEQKIEVYLDRLHKLFLQSRGTSPEGRISEETRERNLELIFNKLCDKFLITELPESYINLQKRIARERGHGDIEVNEEIKERMLETVQADQKHSLREWVTYLSSSDAGYPDWFKYFAFRNILKFSQFDKELGHFKKRTKSTTAPFPDIYRDALARVCDSYTQALKEHDPKKTQDPEVRQLYDAKFADLYAVEIQRSLEASIENSENIEGVWIRYAQTSNRQLDTEYFAGGEEDYEIQEDPGFNDFFDADDNWIGGDWTDNEREQYYNPYGSEGSKTTEQTQNNLEAGIELTVEQNQAEQLHESISGKGTGWCTEGYETAKGQLSQGDFYVYYTNDNNGKPTQPRIAIRMEEDQIGEVRGVLSNQEMEPILQEVLDDKLDEFGDKAEQYKTASVDMKRLTGIDKKVGAGEELTADELKFLYEIDENIHGFGYSRDPRINELRSKRDKLKDYVFMYLGEDRELDESTAFALIDAGQAELVINNLERFNSLDDHNALVRKLLATGNNHIVATHVKKFNSLDKDTALTLIDCGLDGLVATSFEKLNLSDRDDIQELVSRSEKMLNKVTELFLKMSFADLQGDRGQDYLSVLIEEDRSNVCVGKFLDLLYEFEKEPASQVPVVQFIINSGFFEKIFIGDGSEQSSFVGQKRKYNYITFRDEVANLLIESGHLDAIFENPWNFHLSEETILKLLDIVPAKFLIEKRFIGNHNNKDFIDAIRDYLLEQGRISEIVENQKVLIPYRFTYSLVAEWNHFVQKLIKHDQVEILEKLDEVYLPEDIASMLINQGYEELVTHKLNIRFKNAHFYEKIADLNPERAVKKFTIAAARSLKMDYRLLNKLIDMGVKLSWFDDSSGSFLEHLTLDERSKLKERVESLIDEKILKILTENPYTKGGPDRAVVRKIYSLSSVDTIDRHLDTLAEQGKIEHVSSLKNPYSRS